MTDTTQALQSDLNDLSRDVDEIKKVLDAIAQLLRDTQISQAGTDKLSYHTRQEIMKALDDLRAWTNKTEHSLCEINRRTTQLEQDHDDADATTQEILELVRLNRRHVEELLGIRATTLPSPLLLQVREVLSLVRRIADRDPSTGDTLDFIRLLAVKVRNAFWMALAAAIAAWAIWTVHGYLPGHESHALPAQQGKP